MSMVTSCFDGYCGDCFFCDFIKKYESKFDECLREAKEDNRKAYDDLDDICIEEAIEHFEEVANAEEVVGYYLSHYGDEAYTIWSDNTKNIEMTAQDERVEEILSTLFKKGDRNEGKN